MKFKDLKIGDWCEYELYFKDICYKHKSIKIPQFTDWENKYTAIKDTGDVVYIDPEQEVELVNKCENCKYYDDGGDEGYDFCDYLHRSIEHCDDLNEDPKTFSCREFKERK